MKSEQSRQLLPPHEEPTLLPPSGEGNGGHKPKAGGGVPGEELSSMEELLERIEHAVHDGDKKVSLDAILDEVGRRSFGPLLLLAGVITLTPILGDIPGVPTIMGVLVLVTAGQLLFARDHFWLPPWILRRSISRKALCKGLGWMRKPARFFDRMLKPRLTLLVKGPGLVLIAVVCAAIALMMPPMEFVPFSANGAGLALTLFGLSIIAKDGIAALLGFGITATTGTLVAIGLL